VVALYEALGHSLALRRPDSFLPYEGLGQVSKLFEAVAVEHPAIAPARKAVGGIEQLRCVWITHAVTNWPTRGTLPPLFVASLNALMALTPSPSCGELLLVSKRRLQDGGTAEVVSNHLMR
jgi:hypothetical protein